MKKDIEKAYLTILWFALLPAILLTFSIISSYLEGKKAAAVPLPSFEELEVVEGEFKSFRKKSSRFEYDEVMVYLTDGNKYYLSKAIYDILHQTSFETNMREGERIKLWVTDLKEASLNDKTPTIFQIEMHGHIYLSYEDTYSETLRIRNVRAKLMWPILVPANIYFIGFFLYNRIRYKKTGKIPRWAMKELKKIGIYDKSWPNK